MATTVLNAITATTAQNLQLDAGILVTGLTTPASFTGTITTEVLLGATSGGGKFSAIPTFRNLFDGIDGAKGEYKDGLLIDTWEIKMSVQLKELTKDNFVKAIGACDVTTGTTYDTIKGRCNIKSTDYLDNLCWLGSTNGNVKPTIIELKNVLNRSGMNFTASDKGTGALDVEFTAHFSPATPNDVPFAIYTPKLAT